MATSTNSDLKQITLALVSRQEEARDDLTIITNRRLKRTAYRRGDRVDLVGRTPDSPKQVRKKREKQRKQLSFLAREGKFWEFGRLYNPADEVDMADYLRAVQDYITTVRWPKKLQSFISKASEYACHQHRKIALVLLAGAKVQIARLILLAVRRKLTAEIFNAFEPQTAELIVYSTIAVSFCTIFLYLMHKVVSSVQETLRQGNSLVQPARQSIQDFSAVANTVAGVVNNVKDACRTAYKWFRDLLQKIKDAFAKLHACTKKIIYGLLTIVALYMAVSFALTWFPSYAHAVKSYICGKLGISEYEPQAGEGEEEGDESGLIHEIMEFFRRHFTSVKKFDFWKYMDKLPKMVSVAKAIGWIFDHMKDLYYSIVEAITGKKHPRNEIEKDIVDFCTRVEDVSIKLKTSSSMDTNAGAIQNEVTQLEQMLRRIRYQETTSKKVIRPFFSSQFAQDANRLTVVRGDLELILKACKKRPVPVWVYLAGPQGTGKSHIQEKLMANVWKYVQENSDGILSGLFSSAQIFSVPQKETYFDGYGEQPFVMIDDLFQQKDGEIRSDLAAQLINMVAPTPYTLLVADPSQKGHKHFTSKAIFTSTNLLGVGNGAFNGANIGLQEPEALATRRTVIIHVPQRDVYQLEGTLDDKENPFISFDTMVALIGECIIHRDREHHVEAEIYDIPPLHAAFVGGRIAFDLRKGEGEGEKGFESQSGTELPFSLSDEEVDESLTDEIKRRTEEDEEEDSGKRRRRRKRAAYKEYVEAYEDPDRNHVDYKGDDINPLKISATDLYMNRQDAFHYAQLFNDQLTAYFTDFTVPTEQIVFKVDNEVPRQRTLVTDERMLKMLTAKDFEASVKANPGSVIRALGPDFRFVEGDVQEVTRAWSLWMASCIGLAPRAHSDIKPPVDYEFWQKSLGRSYKPLATYLGQQGRVYYEQQRNLSKMRPSLFNVVMMEVGIVVGICVGIGVLIRSMMPAAAHEVQAGYETKLPKVAKQIARRAARRENARIRQGDQKFSAQSDGPVGTLVSAITSVGVVMEEDMDATPVSTAFGFFIGGRTMLCPGHIIPEGKFWLRLGWDGRGENCMYRSEDLLMEEGNSDIIYITFPEGEMRDHRDMRNHFCDEIPTFGELQVVKPAQSIWCLVRGTSWQNHNRWIQVSEGYSYETDLEIHGIPNSRGMCGLPYIHRNTGKILGIHLGGSPSTDTASAAIVLKRDLPESLQVRVTNFEPQTSGPVIPGIKVIGRVERHEASFTPRESNLIRTPFDTKTFPFPETTDMPAALDDIDGISPLRVALSNFAHQRDYSKRHRLTDFSGFIPKDFNRGNVRRLTLTETVYGIPGFIDAIDFTTSSGYFYKRMKLSRRQLFFDQHGNRRIHPIFERDIEQRITMMEKEGKFRATVYENTLKDELRPEAKVKAGMSRLFAAGDLAAFVVARMVLGALYVELTKDPVCSPSSLGIDPHSSQWGRMYTDVRKKENYIPLGGDMRQFDISRKNDVTVDFIRMCQQLSDDPLIALVVRSCEEGEHILGTLVFDRYIGTNSGGFITSLINTFANWRGHKILFEMVYPEESFEELGKKFNGDDSLIGVPPRLVAYDMAYLARGFKEEWNMIYTAADKSDKRTTTWEEVDYLKRKFVVGHAGVMAPLSGGSIANMIKWTEKEFTEEKAVAVFGSVLTEAWHYGSDKYVECLDWIISESKRLGIVTTVPDWMAMWIMRSKSYLYLPSNPPPKHEVKLLVRKGELGSKYKRNASCKTTGNDVLGTETSDDHYPQSGVGMATDFEPPPINEIANTQTSAQDGIQADAPQQLTSPTETTLFQTPTMGFGEVGMTGFQMTTGYASNAHGVGEFEQTTLLERMAVIGEYPWTEADTLGNLVVIDIDKALRTYARNLHVLSQMHYYRSDIEVTVRLVTNQFYYGSIMVTQFPTLTAGETIDARAVLDPTIISATSDESVIKQWDYTWPMAWKPLDTSVVDNYPTYTAIDVLCPLKAAKDGMPDSIVIQIWARFKSIKLAYPKQPPAFEAQSGGKPPTVTYLKKRPAGHPAKDPTSYTVTGSKNSVETAIDAITSITIGDAVKEVKSLASYVTENWGSIASLGMFLLDKPDRVVCQEPIIMEPSIDLFNSDIADSNVSVGLYKGRYVDPGEGRMPMSKNMTISEYARIPGIRQNPIFFTAQNEAVEVVCINVHTTGGTWKIPLDYAWQSAYQWRGSIKVMLQFFTSTFISTRVSVSYINAVEYPSGYPTDYSNGLTKVINIKGDTVDSFTLPWLSTAWWSERNLPRFQIKVVSPIASSDATLDPRIYCVVWVAGGDDIQFAFPRIPLATEWAISTLHPIVPTLEKGAKSDPRGKGKAKAVHKVFESQSAPGKDFQKTFPPICPGGSYDIDRGFSTSELIGPITDVCKRYSPMSHTASGPNDFSGSTLDAIDGTGVPDTTTVFRSTYFGSWRQAFLFRSGGYRYREYDASDGGAGSTYQISSETGYRTLNGTEYRAPGDGMVRLTVPQLSFYPFAYLGMEHQNLSVRRIGSTSTLSTRYIAARDDLQLGWPILPKGMSVTALTKKV